MYRPLAHFVGKRTGLYAALESLFCGNPGYAYEPSFEAPLLTSLVPSRGVGAPTFTRATTKSFVDFEGRVRTGLSGEACFTGARRVQNILSNTIFAGAVANSVAPTGWTRLSSGGTFSPSASVLIPGHQRLDITVNNNREITALTVNVIAGHSYMLSSYCEAVSGNFVDSCMHMVGVTATITTGAPCPTSTAVAGKRMTTPSVYVCTVSGTATFRIGLGTGATETGSGSISLSAPMLEDVTGNSNQNPSEYVSVGAAKQNEFINTETMAANWLVTNSTLTATAGPEGYTNAAILKNNAVGPATFHYTPQNNIFSSPGQYTIAVVAKKVLGSGWLWLLGEQAGDAFAFFDVGNGVVGSLMGFDSSSITPLDNGWYLCTATVTQVTATSAQQFGFGVTTGDTVKSWDSTGLANTQQIALAYPRVRQGTRNAYVPVGNVYTYQGACVDGVQYFGTYNGNTVASNVVTEATGAPIGLTKNQSAYHPGLTGAGFSTPSSVASNVPGDIDIRIDAALVSWASGTPQYLAAKDDTGTQRSWNWFVDGGGVPNFFVSFDGTAGNGATYVATAASGFSAGTRHSLRVTRSAATGNVTFYKSDDGVLWTQIGTVVAGTAGNIFASLSQTDVGARAATVLSGPLTGTIYRAQVYSGINGTLVVDFNPQDYNSGTTWASGTTGETWTINGGASILNFPLKGYDGWQAATNLCLQSADFTTTWSASNLTVGGSVMLPDGTTGTKNKLLLTATAAVTHNVLQTLAKAASALAYTYTIYAKAAEYAFLALRIDSGAGNGCHCSFNLSTGTVSTAATGDGTPFTGLSSSITPAGNGWYRCQINFTTDIATTVRVVPTVQDADGNPFSYTFTAVLNSGLYLWGAQLEQTAFATPYIPTTTVSVTRNADVLTYTSAGNVNGAVGTAMVEMTLPSILPASNPRVLGFGISATPIAVASGNGVLVTFDGTTSINNGAALDMRGGTHRAVARWSSAGISNAVDAGAVSSNVNFDGDMIDGSATFAVGSTAVPNLQMNGNVRNVRIWNRALPDAQLISMTR